MTAPVETAEFPRTPPEVRGAYVYGPVLHRWFAVSAALLLAFVVWMVLQDYEREWKQYQREFRALKAKKIDADLAAEQARIKAELDALIATRDAAETAQKARQADLDKLTRDRDAYKAQDFYRIKQAAGFAKAELDTALFQFEEARKHGGDFAAAQAKLDHWHAQFAARTEELKQAEANLKGMEEALVGHQKAVLDVQAKIAERKRRGENLERSLVRLKASIPNAIREIPLLDFVDPNLKVKQRVFDDLRLDYNFATVPTVDRCETCHLGIDSVEWESDKQPYTAHPRLDLYVHGASPHPVETFGCTVCHNGRPSATEFYQTGHTPDSPEKAHAWHEKHLHHSEHYDEWWNRPMTPTKYAQAACQKCHEDAWELDGAQTLMRGKRLYRDFGCYGCHKAKGGLADVTVAGDLPQRGPDLSHLPAKVTKGWAYQWIWNPRHFRPSTRMPTFFGQSNNQSPEDKRREETEARAAVAYLWAAATPYETARVGRGDPKRGEHLVNAIGCTGCHRIADPPAVDAQGRLTERVAGTGGRNQGPELSRIGAKTTPAWIAAWVKDPKGYSSHTRMPSLRITDTEAQDIAAYLGGLTGGFVADATMPDPDPNEIDRILTEKFLEEASAALARAALDGMTPEARVRKVGELAIRKHGCAGCHPIPGPDPVPPATERIPFQAESKIGVPFSEQPIGSKPLTKLDYGLIGIGHGYEEIGGHGSVAGSVGAAPAGVPHTLHDWITRKLQDPRVYDWGKLKAPKDRLRMPNFEMNAEEADCLVTFLLGQTGDKIPKERMAAATGPFAAEQRGWKVVREHNCVACHTLGLETKTFRRMKKEPDGSERPEDVTVAGTTTDTDEELVYFRVERAHAGLGWAEKDLPKSHDFARKPGGDNPTVLDKRETSAIGGVIAGPLVAYLRKTGKSEGDAKVFTPPSLVGEGDKVQAPWLFGFLKNVETLRPWLEVRMPSFTLTDDEARAIAEFFVARAQRDRRTVLLLEQAAAADAERRETDADRKKALKKTLKGIERQLASTRTAYPFEEHVERTAAYLAEREAALPGYLSRARAFFLHKDVDCLKCHVQGGKTPGGDPSSWAPDLDRARTRLRPEWLTRWITSPSGLQAGTKMPTFPWDTLGTHFPGTAEDRVRALKDLLMNLDRVK